MKKKLSIIALLTVMLTVAIVPLNAFAQSFTIYSVNCYSESAPVKYYPTQVWKYTSYQKVYVNHTASGTSNSYTNLFHATRSSSTGQTGILSGSKWCTPNLNVPIQSNSLYSDYYYGLAARGNTKYNDYEGLTQFTVTGSYNPNRN